MKEVKCGMVEDLFDSYREQLTSDETSAMIKTHLSECAGCRKKYADFSHLREEEENKEKNKEEKFQKKLLTYRRCGIGILIGAIVSVITVAALGIIFLLLVFFGGPPYITKDAAKYEAAMQRYDNIQCGFAVFPDKIAAEAEVEEFYFSYQDTWDDPTCEVFLQCHYPTQVYEKEIQRLEAVERVYGENVKKLLKEDAGRFSYPVYIAIDNHNYGYEYALLSGKNEITYVYTAFKKRHNIHFDEKYLPSDYGELYYEGMDIDKWEVLHWNDPKVDVGRIKAEVVLSGYSIYLDSQASDAEG